MLKSIITAPNVVVRHTKKKTHIIVKTIHSSLRSESKNVKSKNLKIIERLVNIINKNKKLVIKKGVRIIAENILADPYSSRKIFQLKNK